VGWLSKRDRDYLRGEQMSAEGIEIRLSKLSLEMQKMQLACAVCKYDAEWILKIDKLERLFCERDLLNALFDALNFNLPSEASV
jgi:hypothetical protein